MIEEQFNEQLQGIRRHFIEQVSFLTLLLTLLILALSLGSRNLTGFSVTILIQILLVLCIGTVWLLRRRLPAALTAIISVCIYTILSINGFLLYGLLGTGACFMVAALFLTAATYGFRPAILTALLFLFVVIAIAYLWVTGYLQLPAGYSETMQQPVTWVQAIACSLGMATLLVIPITGYQRGLAGLAADVDKQKQTIEELANNDQLTGLPTMRLVEDRFAIALAGAKRNYTVLALLFIDLDDFKQVNDRNGHAAGDLVLQETAKRLKTALREYDTVGRIGGDEFLIILGNLDNDDMNLFMIAERLLSAVSEPVKTGNSLLTITASIGGALYPQHGDDLFTLRRNADRAMYAVKRSGKNSFRIFSETGD